MNIWRVYLGYTQIDTVYFTIGYDREYVYNSLVNHDGYSPAIRLVKTRKKK